MMKWLLAIISGILAIIINFNSSSIISMVIFSIITGAAIFFGASIIINSIKTMKEKPLKSLLFIVLVFVGGGILYIALFGSLYGGCIQMVVNDYLRTNIITGKCDYGGGAPNPCKAETPWYYQKGCEGVSKEEIIELIKQSSNMVTMRDWCTMFCNAQNGLDSPNCNISVPIVSPETGKIFCSDFFS